MSTVDSRDDCVPYPKPIGVWWITDSFILNSINYAKSMPVVIMCRGQMPCGIY
jgi:hypothetical protein